MCPFVDRVQRLGGHLGRCFADAVGSITRTVPGGQVWSGLACDDLRLVGLKLIFLVVTRAVSVLGLSRREAWWKDRAGLLDEIQLHLVPILLGAGRRLFDHTGEASRELELTGVNEAPGVTHLRYRLPK